MLTNRIMALALACLLLSSASVAADMKGIALVRIAAKHVKLEMHYAVSLTEDHAFFSALDDFGGTPFVIAFDKNHLSIRTAGGETRLSGGKLKSILSLPLTQAEMLAVLRGDNVPLRGKMKITLSDFLANPGVNPYPRHILITRGKNEFELTWQSVKVD